MPNQDNQPTTIYPCIKVPYSPSKQMVPEDEKRAIVRLRNRWLILDVAGHEGVRPDSEIAEAIRHASSIRMNKDYQPAYWGKGSKGEAKAREKFREWFDKTSKEKMPHEFHGKLRLIGEEDILPNDTPGQFIRMSYLFSETTSETKKEMARRELREEAIKELAELGITITPEQLEKFLTKKI